MAGIGRGNNSSIEGKRGGNLGKYHTSDCYGDQQPVSHDSSLSRLQPVVWVLERFPLLLTKPGGGLLAHGREHFRGQTPKKN